MHLRGQTFSTNATRDCPHFRAAVRMKPGASLWIRVLVVRTAVQWCPGLPPATTPDGPSAAERELHIEQMKGRKKLKLKLANMLAGDTLHDEHGHEHARIYEAYICARISRMCGVER